jgi:hypothetical protein
MKRCFFPLLDPDPGAGGGGVTPPDGGGAGNPFDVADLVTQIKAALPSTEPLTAAQIADAVALILPKQESTPPPPAPSPAPDNSDAIATMQYELAVLKANVPAKVLPYLPKGLAELTTFLASDHYKNLVEAFSEPPAPKAVPTPPAGSGDTPPPADLKVPNFLRVGKRLT